MKRVYISHPYAEAPEENKEKVEAICKDLMKTGIVLPISPLHLFSFATDEHRRPILTACMELVSVTDEVWMYGDSEGCKLEAQVAKQLGIPVINKFFTP